MLGGCKGSDERHPGAVGLGERVVAAEHGAHGVEIAHGGGALEWMKVAVGAHAKAHIGLGLKDGGAGPPRTAGGGIDVKTEQRLPDLAVVGHKAVALEGARGKDIVIGCDGLGIAAGYAGDLAAADDARGDSRLMEDIAAQLHEALAQHILHTHAEQ